MDQVRQIGSALLRDSDLRGYTLEEIVEVRGRLPNRLETLVLRGAVCEQVLRERVDEFEQGLERDAEVGAVPKRGSGVDAVVVSASRLADVDVASLCQVAEDSVCRAFGDADLEGHGSQSGVRVSCDVEEDLEVVREEPPLLLSIT